VTVERVDCVPGPTAVYAGRGAVARLPAVLRDLAATRVLVVHGTTSYDRCGAAPVVGSLPRWWPTAHYAAARPNPTVELVAAGLAYAREVAPDTVVGIGGGSALDLAKAIAVLSTQDGEPAAYLAGRRELDGGRHRLVLVPTTCGSGSEVTRFATVYSGHEKRSLDHPSLYADVALVDPAVSASVPPEPAAAAGADALAQAVESWWAVAGTPTSRDLARRAVGLLAPALGGGPGGDLALGATLAGAAIDLTRTTAAHALSYPLTARLGIPHGLAVALHLRWLLDHVGGVTADDCDHPDGPEAVRAIVGDLYATTRPLLDQLLRAGGQPGGLAGLRLEPGGWHGIWARALDSVRARNTPRRVSAEDVRRAASGGGDG